jgi:voltage-gated potassium channel
MDPGNAARHRDAVGRDRPASNKREMDVTATQHGTASPAGMDERSLRWERRFNAPILVAALLTIPLVVLQSSNVGAPWNTVLDVFDWLTWSVFAVEVIVMLAVVPDRWRWLGTHPIDVAVVVLTPPFLSVALKSLRILRILRVLPLARLAPTMRTMFSLDGIRYATALALVTLIGGAEAFASAEKVSIGNSVYWAITTMTTVGYGDIVPKTSIGKVVACVMMLVGLAFIALLTGAIAQRFLAAEEAQVKESVSDVEATETEMLEELAAIGQRLQALESRVRRQAQTGRGSANG